jgi:protein-S-isoprenylcysteine O-methyltransferase Ste14
VKSLELRVPPPVAMLLAAALMWLAALALPALDFPLEARGPIAAIVALAGVAIAGVAFFQFRRAGTTVNPMKPGESAVLVTQGIYRFSRNPMYVGDALMLIGWALWLANAAALALVALFVVYLNRYQIAPEERALEARYGAPYAEYCRAVRRWL